jgi:hypothetical protein
MQLFLWEAHGLTPGMRSSPRRSRPAPPGGDHQL